MNVGLAILLLITGGSQADQPPHEGPSRDPWLLGPERVVRVGVARATPVRLDDYESIQVNVDARGYNIVGDAANEPSIAVDPTDPRRIVIGWRQFDTVESSFRQAGWAYSHDAGHTWVFPGVVEPGRFRSDPVLAAGPNGEIYYCSVRTEPETACDLFRSLDGGVTWGEPAYAFGGDKPWMVVDNTDGPGRGVIYVTPRLSRSFDNGASFQAGPGALGYGTMGVATDSTLYFATAILFTSNSYVTRSRNAYLETETPVFEELTDDFLRGRVLARGYQGDGLAGQPWIGVDLSGGPTHGWIYVFGTTLVPPNALRVFEVRFARSTDGGETWSEPIRVSDAGPADFIREFFGTMSLAPAGRIDTIWFDPRNSKSTPAIVELFYSSSVDGGTTWSANVPLGPPFDRTVGYPHGSEKLGDYYHMHSDNLGANLAFAATYNGEQDVYFLRIGPWDCNGNEVPDEDDIDAGSSLDCNANTVPDECEYRGDFDGDTLTTLRDLAAYQNCFGAEVPLPAIGVIDQPADTAARIPFPTAATTGHPSDPCCHLFDLDEDESVDTADLPILNRVLTGP